MNLNEMTEQEKSIMLARLCGWQVVEGVNLAWIDDNGTHLFTVTKYDNQRDIYPTLYDVRNIALAIKVMQWADSNLLKNNSYEYRWCFAYNFLHDTPTALDKILSLAIKNGMVTE